LQEENPPSATPPLSLIACSNESAGPLEGPGDGKGGLIRKFETGATRDIDEDKFDFEGFLSPTALERFGQYMHEHRVQPDGNLRDSDNWQKGIPLRSYMKSLVRHAIYMWYWWRTGTVLKKKPRDPADEFELACSILFNAQGILHELLKGAKRD
jgi:hypothetical protein